MTQKYEPVEWTDETPTQPGTLINKARMDQMQSAHHFADGFEEVDAIPTEDPGTDYHKVVYCTADSTFYRWDGTQWTADIDDDTKRLLEEHEADHANPHQVTKAQVGLGNADNTSDADKPISTATAAALATKAEDSTVVHNTGAETIDGKKTFTKNPVISGAPPALTLINTLDTWVSPPSADAYASIGFSDKDNVAVGNVGTVHKAGTGERRTYLSARTSGGSVTAELDVVISSDGSTKYATAPARAYNAANTDDVVTIGTLATPLALKADDSAVVHNTGNENVDGIKTFIKEIRKRGPAVGSGNISYDIMRGYDENNSRLWEICSSSRADNSTRIYVNTLKTDGTFESVVLSDGGMNPSNKVATLATLDAYPTMLRTVNNQTAGGIKTFTDGIIAYAQGWHGTAGNGQAQGQWAIFAKIHPTSVGAYHYIEFTQNSNTASAYGTLVLHESASTPTPVWINRVSRGSNDPLGSVNTVTVLSDGTDLYLAWKKEVPYGGLGARSFFGWSYGSVRAPDTNITWYEPADRTVLSTLDGYTVHDPEDREVRTTGAQTIAGAKTFTAQMLATGQRAYDPANTGDVATIGTLDAYTPMVRTTGNQIIAGLKTFTDQIRRISPDWSYLELRATRADRHTIPSANIRMGGISFQDGNGEAIVSLAVDLLTDGHINIILEGVDSNEQYWNSVILNRQVIY